MPVLRCKTYFTRFTSHVDQRGRTAWSPEHSARLDDAMSFPDRRAADRILAEIKQNHRERFGHDVMVLDFEVVEL